MGDRLGQLAACVALMGCAALTGCVAPAPEPPPRDPTFVSTTEGPVQGQAADGVVMFKGIPYAAPPVGALRWKPPQPPAKRDSPLAAAAFGAGCPTIDGARIMQGRRIVTGGADIFVGVPPAPGTGEDCLRLNIWAPADAEKASVMVWLQPLGASSQAMFDGGSFARDGVVFVTLDFRQLSLGNFAHPALTREAGADEPLGRFQTMDQIAALRWIKQNIANFGGDPGNVTVFGLSASAASTLQLLTIPAAKGLVDKAIVQSGVGWWTPFSLSQMERTGAVFASAAGLPGAAATADELRAIPLEKLPQIGVYNVDGRLQPDNATWLMDAGRMADIPLMIGWTDNDGSSLRSMSPSDYAAQASAELQAVYAPDNKTGADLGYQMYTDAHVGAPARWIARKASEGAPSYLYLFSYVRADNRGKARGAAHGDDLTYVFDNWEKLYPSLVLSEEDRAATRMMHGCWISFARTGKPSCEGVPDWPRYTADGDQLMELGLAPQVRTGFRKRQLDAQENAWRGRRAEDESRVEQAIRQLEAEGVAVR